MRVLADLRLLRRQVTGVGRYLGALAAGLPAALEPSTEWLALGGPDILDARWQRVGGVLPAPLSPFQFAALPWRVRGVPRDVFFYPHFDVPWGLRGPVIATCYDLEPLIAPHLFAPRIRVYYRALAHRLRRADRVVCISKKTADDVHELLRIPRDRLCVVYLGVDERFRAGDPQEAEAAREALSLPSQYLLYVGNTMPHKNVTRLIDAVAVLHQRGCDVPLILAGREDRYRQDVLDAVHDRSILQCVRFIGEVPEALLPGLMAGATAFGFPSLYEGFGLPVAEAMASGTPVVCSSRGALAEVAGDAGVIVDPDSIDSIADGFARVLESPGVRGRHRAAGLRQAERFTWSACVEAHGALIREVCS